MKRIIAVLLIVMLSIAVSACGGNQVTDVRTISNESVESEDYDVVLCILGNHKWGKPFNLETNAEVRNVVSRRGRVVLLETGGRPYVDQDIELPKEKEGVTERTRERNDSNLCAELGAYASTIMPIESEHDLITSFCLGGKVLSNYEGSKAVVILDNGIFTSGPITMSYLLSHDTEIVIDYLRSQHCIPDLEGVAVTLVGIGEPSGEQKPPNANDDFKLRQFYEEYFYAAGAKSVKTVTSGSSDIFNNDDFPDVSVYEWPNFVSLTNDAIQFKVDSSEFIDEKEANRVIAEAVTSYSVGAEILVAGFASSEGNAKDNVELSKARAERVAGVLAKLGLKPKAVGRGFDLDYCEPDYIGGAFNESIASRNRKVVIMDMNSEDARTLMGD